MFTPILDILLLTFFSILLALIMDFPVNLLSKFLPRGLSVLTTLLLGVGSITGGVFLIGPTLIVQFRHLWSRIPAAVDQLDDLAGYLARLGLASKEELVNVAKASVGENLNLVVSQVLPITFGVVGIFTSSILVIALSAFFVHQPRAYLHGLRILTPQNYQRDLDEVFVRLESSLRQWILGTFMAMLMMGGFTGLGLWWVGVEGLFSLGVLTFFATFVPYAGAVLSAVPGLLVGLSQSTHHFFWALAVYAGVHLIESYLVEPLLMKQVVSLRPALLLLSQILMATWFGIVGLLVATPSLILIKVLVEYFYVEKYQHR